MRDLPHLVYLQAFEAAARHLSFTRAAEELNCTQAAISQRIRGLEQYFGRPLFHRKPNGLELSSAGKAYLPGISQALDVMESATQGLTGRKVRRSVTVSAPTSFINLWLSQRLGGFIERHPGTSLRLNSAIWTDPNVDLADVSIIIVERSLLSGEDTALAPAPVVWVSAPGPALWTSRRIEVQGKYPLWDLWSEGSGQRFDPEQPPHRVDTADTALRLATQGLGQTVVYDQYARDLVLAGRLEGSDPVEIGHVLTLRPNPNRRPSSAARAFIEWLSDRVPLMEAQVPHRGDAG